MYNATGDATAMRERTHTITAEELFRMPDDGFKYELVRGTLKRMSPPGWEHGAMTARLTAVLVDHVERNRLGVVTAGDSGFALARDPDTVRGPDVAVVRRERMSASGVPKAYWEGAPDLAVEIKSPGDTHGEIREKITDYLAAGATEVWIVDPASRTVSTHRVGVAPRVLASDDVLESPDLLSGFRYRLAELWMFP